jgi:hypothetical protein
MSEMLWCDRGNHPFSANDPKRTAFTETQTYVDAQSGKRPVRVDTCGPCNAGQQVTDVVRELMAPSRKRTPAEVAEARGYDPEYVKWLEKQNGVETDA